MKKLIHFVPQYFLNPIHPIKVSLIGAGGNGSQMLSALARINHALIEMGGLGLNVTIYDPDTVESTNVGRQLFTVGEIGMNKAECLVSRFNRMYGTAWRAYPSKYKMNDSPNIIITCVDNIETRKEIGKYFRKKNLTAKHFNKNKGNYGYGYNEHYLFYWLDLGNAQKTGQAVLGANRIPQPESEKYETIEYLPCATEQFRLNKSMERDSGPSCSMAEALSKQDLFVNSVLVQTAGSMLWSLLTDVAIDTRGFYINLDTYRTAPIPIKQEDLQLIPKTIQNK